MRTLALIFLPLVLEISWLGMQLLENRKIPEVFTNENQAIPSCEIKHAKDCFFLQNNSNSLRRPGRSASARF